MCFVVALDTAVENTEFSVILNPCHSIYCADYRRVWCQAALAHRFHILCQYIKTQKFAKPLQQLAKKTPFPYDP